MGLSQGITKRDHFGLSRGFADHAEADATLACKFGQVSVETLGQREEEFVVLAAVGGEVRSQGISFVDRLTAWQ